MVSGRARQILEAIGFISIVGSLIFVGFEMRQTQQISSAEQDLSRAEISMDLRESINENIDIWIAGNAGKSLDESSSIIYKSLVMSSWDKAEALAQARSRLGSDSNLAIHQFSIFLFENPGARLTWTQEIEKETDNRMLLDYNVPGFDLRRNIVFQDLEKLTQQTLNESTQQVDATSPTPTMTREQLDALSAEKR